MKNQSLRNEYAFIDFMNNKPFKEFPVKWQKHLKRMFEDIQDDTIVYCSKHENYFAKGDVDIRIKGGKKIVSLKSGKNACMHRERFRWFYQYLKELGVSWNTLNILVLYQFGESRIFGHEEKPLTKEEIVEKYSRLILKANQELNKEEIIDAVIERAVLRGRKEYRQSIDYLYYGNIEKGLLISVDQIKESIKLRKQISDSWIQFGQLVFQPGGRSRENEDYLETTIRWPILGKLFYISEDEDDIIKNHIDG